MDAVKPWYPIETARLRLRAFRACDEADVHEYASDPEVVRFMSWGPNTIEQTHAVLAGWLEEQKSWPRDSVTLAIELKDEQRVIGAIRFDLRDPDHRTADMGYTLNRKYWGRGFATEAARTLLDTAFRTLELHRVWATCDVNNHASYRVMEKIGMRREALFVHDVKIRGAWRNSFQYAVVADEWLIPK